MEGQALSRLSLARLPPLLPEASCSLGKVSLSRGLKMGWSCRGQAERGKEHGPGQPDFPWGDEDSRHLKDVDRVM